jgi:hypothetical protein
MQNDSKLRLVIGFITLAYMKGESSHQTNGTPQPPFGMCQAISKSHASYYMLFLL